jgi:hypothetical protein
MNQARHGIYLDSKQTVKLALANNGKHLMVQYLNRMHHGYLILVRTVDLITPWANVVSKAVQVKPKSTVILD